MKWIRRVSLKIQSGHDSVNRRSDGQADGRTDKVRPVYPTPTSLQPGGGGSYYDIQIQIVLPLSSAHVLMAKNDAHYLIYMYICITPRAPDKDVKAYILGLTEDIAIKQQYIHDKMKLANVIVNWSLFITRSVFSKLSPIDKTLFTHSWEWGMACLLWVQGIW